MTILFSLSVLSVSLISIYVMDNFFFSRNLSRNASHPIVLIQEICTRIYGKKDFQFLLVDRKIDESFDRDLENRSSVFQTIFVFTFIIIIGRNEENGTAMILYINIYIFDDRGKK